MREIFIFIFCFKFHSTSENLWYFFHFKGFTQMIIFPEFSLCWKCVWICWTDVENAPCVFERQRLYKFTFSHINGLKKEKLSAFPLLENDTSLKQAALFQFTLCVCVISTLSDTQTFRHKILPLHFNGCDFGIYSVLFFQRSLILELDMIYVTTRRLLIINIIIINSLWGFII